MRKLLNTFCLAILLQWPVHGALAVEASSPFAEIEEVMDSLMENHINKPTESQLVQGALKRVSEQIGKRAKATVTPSAEDDTRSEMEYRLREWQTRYGLDAAGLNRTAIEGMLATLDDPHTMLFTKEELRRFQSSVDNEYVGFGFRLRMQENRLMIRDIIPNSPAAAADLRPGDHLLDVDGISLTNKSFEEAFALLKGEEGSEAVLTIYRPSENRTKHLKLRRATLAIPEVSGMPFDGNIGYIRLDTFGSDSAVQFRNQLLSFMQKGQTQHGLILDLRDNGGGYLSAARDIASLFMEEGLLMYMVDRNGVEIETWVHNGQDVGFPVRILVNQGTASASELLSGALRDHGIAKLVGTVTYGKGSAQQVIPLENGDALKITLHEYFTPRHTVVNHVGLAPDIAVKHEIAQVLEALRSLGVTRFELRESGDEVTVNGVDFPVAEPIFHNDAHGIQVHRAVLASLLQDSAIGDTGYASLSSIGKPVKNLAVRKQGPETILTYTLQ
ncbi:S41 family peptidase [Brevibacillus sp. SYP-B805]|uniref:S41 family peptidase n=1 Tax=Brevibacillus sp. SYP-B805 TaxID=1578199 RepID=UPI0013EB3F0A|nr:S41 family peptidase [Brevibacillus sp. SYP-B805]NGQ94092.1 S41 family peptidase [Brevibacillus sp. SYP-B805]